MYSGSKHAGKNRKGSETRSATLKKNTLASSQQPLRLTSADGMVIQRVVESGLGWYTIVKVNSGPQKGKLVRILGPYAPLGQQIGYFVSGMETRFQTSHTYEELDPVDPSELQQVTNSNDMGMEVEESSGSSFLKPSTGIPEDDFKTPSTLSKPGGFKVPSSRPPVPKFDDRFSSMPPPPSKFGGFKSPSSRPPIPKFQDSFSMPSSGFKPQKSTSTFQMPSLFGSSGGEMKTLYRGVHSKEQAEQIQAVGSAGGEIPDSSVLPPNSEQMISQVGMDDTAPWAKKSTPFKPSDVVEYTTDPSIAQSYGNTRGGYIVVRINTKYLTRGDSGIAQGWIARKSAPIEFLEYHPPTGK